MTVAGIGIDIVDVAGFAAQLQAVGTALAQEAFTPGERAAAAAGRAGPAVHLAGRFAAKEAFVKAFSVARTGRAPALPGTNWRAVEVQVDPWGRPALALHGDMARAVADTLGRVRIHVSISHDAATAVAVVVIESGAGDERGDEPYESSATARR